VKVLTNRALKQVTKDGAHITQIATSDGAFAAKVFVDASYEGDLMATAGVSWTIGREGRNDFGEIARREAVSENRRWRSPASLTTASRCRSSRRPTPVRRRTATGT